MELIDNFQKDYFSFDVEGGDFLEVAKEVEQKLKSLDLIEDTYLEALVKRESTYPTGLITQFLNIALPHTDPEHIKKPFVFGVKLKQPITVKQMGDGQDMLVENMFFLGIKNPSEQVKLLQLIMNLFMNETFVKEYGAVATESEAFALIKKSLEETIKEAV